MSLYCKNQMVLLCRFFEKRWFSSIFIVVVVVVVSSSQLTWLPLLLVPSVTDAPVVTATITQRDNDAKRIETFSASTRTTKTTTTTTTIAELMNNEILRWIPTAKPPKKETSIKNDSTSRKSRRRNRRNRLLNVLSLYSSATTAISAHPTESSATLEITVPPSDSLANDTEAFSLSSIIPSRTVSLVTNSPSYSIGEVLRRRTYQPTPLVSRPSHLPSTEPSSLPVALPTSIPSWSPTTKKSPAPLYMTLPTSNAPVSLTPTVPPVSSAPLSSAPWSTPPTVSPPTLWPTVQPTTFLLTSWPTIWPTSWQFETPVPSALPGTTWLTSSRPTFTRRTVAPSLLSFTSAPVATPPTPTTLNLLIIAPITTSLPPSIAPVRPTLESRPIVPVWLGTESPQVRPVPTTFTPSISPTIDLFNLPSVTTPAHWWVPPPVPEQPFESLPTAAAPTRVIESSPTTNEAPNRIQEIFDTTRNLTALELDEFILELKIIGGSSVTENRERYDNNGDNNSINSMNSTQKRSVNASAVTEVVESYLFKEMSYSNLYDVVLQILRENQLVTSNGHTAIIFKAKYAGLAAFSSEPERQSADTSKLSYVEPPTSAELRSEQGYLLTDLERFQRYMDSALGTNLSDENSVRAIVVQASLGGIKTDNQKEVGTVDGASPMTDSTNVTNTKGRKRFRAIVAIMIIVTISMAGLATYIIGVRRCVKRDNTSEYQQQHKLQSLHNDPEKDNCYDDVSTVISNPMASVLQSASQSSGSHKDLHKPLNETHSAPATLVMMESTNEWIKGFQWPRRRTEPTCTITQSTCQNTLTSNNLDPSIQIHGQKSTVTDIPDSRNSRGTLLNGHHPLPSRTSKRSTSNGHTALKIPVLPVLPIPTFVSVVLATSHKGNIYDDENCEDCDDELTECFSPPRVIEVTPHSCQNSLQPHDDINNNDDNILDEILTLPTIPNNE